MLDPYLFSVPCRFISIWLIKSNRYRQPWPTKLSQTRLHLHRRLQQIQNSNERRIVARLSSGSAGDGIIEKECIRVPISFSRSYAVSKTKIISVRIVRYSPEIAAFNVTNLYFYNKLSCRRETRATLCISWNIVLLLYEWHKQITCQKVLPPTCIWRPSREWSHRDFVEIFCTVKL